MEKRRGREEDSCSRDEEVRWSELRTTASHDLDCLVSFLPPTSDTPPRTTVHRVPLDDLRASATIPVQGQLQQILPSLQSLHLLTTRTGH